ncbi:WD40 repeat domain-containing protein [Nostoc sp. FACHB-87]|uniref:nSTAND1 domain-containing NTPase n=1 Tax=Nostocaceae TaxID=1162 RepID=UPI001682D0F5|nr:MULTISPECIES: WD40 repeat domain-containing protein [Nostocaceae]MBD2458170.1 WD40 repeat domain-containing protein [Nostoc sp. FACHB-87]MBD2479385.1 WD40 repeat domain-containing protein [Anabaena sp. FACHB-83]
MTQPPNSLEPQQPNANSTQQAHSYTPQNSLEGNQNRVIQGNENQSVLGDDNTVVQGNNITQNIHIINYYYREDIRVYAAKPASDFSTDEKLPCPYRGLYHFSPDDAEYFFGREVFIEELFRATQTQNFIPVLGASGSGKSSVVLAGLVPKLQQQGHWLFTHFRPGSEPFYALAQALVPLYESEINATEQMYQARQLAEYLINGSVPLKDVFQRIERNYANHRVLLIADQFEELYTLCSDEEIRYSFLDTLITTFQSEFKQFSSPPVLVSTMRTDFLGNALAYPIFADVLKADVKLIGSMNHSELSQVIEKPAQKLGVSFEAGLVKRILDDVKQEPGNLPLLEFALTQLWVKQRQGVLTHQAYSEIGGVEQALANHAEEVYNKLSQEAQKQAQIIFLQLVRPGEGTEDTRRLATRAEVKNWELVTFLAGNEARLVVTGHNEHSRENTVELVHEALVREWGRLRGWIKSDRIFRTWQEILRLRIREWENARRDEDLLLRGIPLAEAENWLKQRQNELSQAEQGFIQLSLALRDRDRKQKEGRRKLTLFGLTGGLVVVSMLAVIAFWLRWTAKVEASGVTALRNFESGDGEIEALVSAMEAGQEVKKITFWNSQCLQDCPATSPLLALQKILDNIHQTNQINTYQKGVNSIRFINNFTQKDKQEEQELIVAGGENGTVTWWNYQKKKLERLKYVKLHPNNSIKSIDFNEDQTILATGASNGWVKLWDVSQKQNFLSQDQQWTPPNIASIQHQCDIEDDSVKEDDQKCSVNNVRFIGRNSELLATTGDDGKVKLWSFQGKFVTKEPILTINAHQKSIKSLNPNPDNNQQFATAGEDGLAQLWDINQTKPIATFKGHQCNVKDTKKCSVNSVWFYPKRKQLATAGDDGTFRLWDFSGKEVAKFEAHPEGVETVRIKDELIATSGSDGTVKLWDFNGKLQAELKGHKGNVVSIRFNDDGNTLASAGKDDGTVRFWAVPRKSSIKPKNPLTELKEHTQTVNSVRFHPKGDLLVTASDDDTVKLWKREGDTIMQITSFPTKHKGVASVRFSPKENILATGGKNGKIGLWDYSGNWLKEFKGHDRPIRSINFNKNIDEFATAGDDDMVKLWNSKGEKLAEFKHPGKLETTRFSPDSKLIATVGENGGRLWNINDDKKPLAELKLDQGYVRTISFSPKENKLATAGDDGMIRLWDFSGKEVTKPFKTYQGRVTYITFSPDGKFLATASATNKIRLWNLSGQQVAELTGHQGNIKSADFSPDGKFLATASTDKTVIVWRIRGLNELLNEGCDRLKDYFVTAPDVKKKFSVCR